MLYVLFFVVFYCLVPSESSEQQKSRKLALQTVLNFGSKGITYDPKILDYFRQFIDKIKVTVSKKNSQQSRAHESGERHMKFSEFFQKFIAIVNKLSDHELENLLNVVSVEARKYNYKGCKFYELVEIPELRRALGHSLDLLQTIPIHVVRKNMDHILKKMTDNSLNSLAMDAVNFVNFLYDDKQSDKMQHILGRLSSYQRNSKRQSNKRLNDIVREGLQALIFDHYTNMPEIGRDFLKLQISKLYDSKRTTKTYGTDDETTEVKKNKISSYKSVANELVARGKAKTKTKDASVKAKHVSDEEDKEEQSESVPKKTTEFPHKFISLYAEEKKTKSTTLGVKTSSTKKHKKFKLENKKYPIPSASEETARTDGPKHHQKSTRIISETENDSKEDTSKKVGVKDTFVSSRSVSNEMVSVKTTKKTHTKKTPKKVPVTEKVSSSFSSEVWSKVTTKGKTRTPTTKYDSFFGLSISSSSESLWSNRGTKTARTTTRKPLKRIRPHPPVDKDKKNKSSKKRSQKRTETKTAKKSEMITRSRSTEDEDSKTRLKETDNATTPNLLWEIGVGLFEAAMKLGHTEKPETEKPDKNDHLREKHSKTKDRRSSNEKDESRSDISGNNKLWLSTSTKNTDGILRNKRKHKTVHGKLKKNKPKKNDSSIESDNSEEPDHSKEIIISKPAREHIIERDGFIQSLVNSKPIHASTTTRTTAQDDRRMYWASAPMMQQGVVPRVLRSEEYSDSSGAYYDSDYNARKDYRVEQGLSIEAYTPHNSRKLLNPVEITDNTANNTNDSDTQNLTITNVESVIKKTIEGSAHDPHLKEHIHNLEQLVKDLKNKFDNDTSNTTTQEKNVLTDDETLSGGNTLKIEKTDNFLDTDETDSTSGEFLKDYARSSSLERKYESEEPKAETVFRASPIKPNDKIYTTKLVTKIIHSNELLFEIPRMHMKNQTLARILKPVVKLSDDDISNIIPGGNVHEGKPMNKQSAVHKNCKCGATCNCKGGCNRSCNHSNNATTKEGTKIRKD